MEDQGRDKESMNYVNDIISIEDAKEDVIQRGVHFASHLSLYKIRKEGITDPVEKSLIYFDYISKIKHLMVENGIPGEEINKYVSSTAMWVVGTII